MPYWIKHFLVAVAISAVTAAVSLALGGPLWVLSGAFFYLGREIRDVEKSHNWNWKRFDWKGLVAPAVPLLVLQLYLVLEVT